MTDAIDPLQDAALFVRPPAERIPAALVGTEAGAVYGQLVRWHDGIEHRRRRERVERFIARIDPEQAGNKTAAMAAAAADPGDARYDVPLAVVAGEIGVVAADIDRVVTFARAAARGMGPGATGEPVEAIAVVPGLLELVPGDEELDASNRIGLLLQTCDAVAGLVAVALARIGDVAVGRGEARRVVTSMLRDDPPVTLARRFRSDGGLITADIRDRPFGAGPHRCPGEALALALAAGTVAGLSGTVS